MTNQTVKKDPHNKGRLTLLERSRSIWQGHVESNHDLRFWRPLY